jgi:Uma2 family endonuclease
MSAVAHRMHYTLSEYLAFEASSNVKHEYLDGQIYAMAGGTPTHAALAAGIVGQLYAQLRGTPCRPHSSDLRVRVTATGLLTYPDVTVVCGARELDREDAMAITNPAVIVEVLSRSTEEYDRGDKFTHYKQIASLRGYVLVSQGERSVEIWTRGAHDTWTVRTAADGETAELTSIAAQLNVRELYDMAEPAG